MITKEAIEAAARAMCEAWHYSKIGTPDGDAEWARKQDQYRTQARAALTAAFAAMPGPAVNDFALPQDVIDSLIAIGPVEWGVSLTQSDEKHAADLMDTLRITREHFGMTDEETGIHGVYLSGTGVVLAHTGMSPNSPQHARILTGAWNMLVDHANSAPTTPAPDLASENERMRAALEWYGEQAAATFRLKAIPDALMAIVAALSLDSGKRAKAALERT